MQEEIERKFLLNVDETEKLLGHEKKSIGIAQWYGKDKKRIRLEITKEKTGFRHEWTENFKTDTSNPSVRIEKERTINPKDLNFDELKEMKCIFKIRHVLKEDPEIVLDEFIEIDGNKVKNLYGEKIDFLLEIEKKSKDFDFEEEIKNLGVSAKDVTDNEDKAYNNFNLAQNFAVSPYRIIEFLQNRLLGEVKVLAMQGRSLYSNLMRNENENYKVDIFRDPKRAKEVVEDLKKIKDDKFYKLSAELESLFLIVQNGFRIGEVTYITFPDKDPIHIEKDGTPKIYKFLKELTQTYFKCKVNQHFLNYNPEDEKSAVAAVKELWDFLESTFKEEKREIIMDVSGGQKYPSIVASLYFLLNNRAFYYNQQNGILTKFPPIPITWNFNVLDENLSAFKLVGKNNGKDFSYEEYLSLPGFFKDLFELNDELGINTSLPLNDIFNKYMQARKMPFGYGEKFIELIEDGKMRDFIINKITKKWSLMWIGDQIPETVEHSQRHSKRLMEFTVNLINTIGEETFLMGVPQTLKDEFYFVLGSAMNVHDLGHTALSYVLNDGRKLLLSGLPSIVRDLHNELSYQMLIHPQVKKMYGLLDGIEKFAEGENLEKAISLVSRYHRNHMPIESKTKLKQKKYLSVFNIKVEPLEDVVKREFNGSKDWQDLTIAATRWLKFIDACDVQSDRTIMKEYNEVRTWRTKSEVLALCDDLLEDEKTWESDLPLSFKEKVEEISALAGEPSKNSTKLEEIAKEIEEFIYDEIKRNIERNQSDFRIIVNEYFRKLDKLVFKARQFPHFKKHQLVQAIYPTFYRRKDSGSKGRILYMKIEKENVNEKQDEKIIENVKKDIKKEFEDAGLSKYAIKSISFE